MEPQSVPHKPHGGYSPDTHRLDYFVSQVEVAVACKILAELLQSSEAHLWKSTGAALCRRPQS